MNDFAASIFSCEEGAAKPELPIFRLCLERLGVASAECLFLDDSRMNVEGARAAGIPSEEFRPCAEAGFKLKRRWALPVESLMRGSD
jgi:FMN phosphatase YigB (HAD superfamily)